MLGSTLEGTFRRFLRLTCGHVDLLLDPLFIHPPTVSPNLDVDPGASQTEKYPDLILTTRNDDNLREVEAELVEPMIEPTGNLLVIQIVEMMLIVMGLDR